MLTIIFEAHATTLDNEAHLASGWNDIELSSLGKRQAAELGERYKNENFDAIFCSDLKRTYNTAGIAFAGRNFKIIRDARLRECNYGDLTQNPEDKVKSLKSEYIYEPFPRGESYEQTSERMKDFLSDLLKEYDGKKVMIIGHRATQYGLDRWINKVSLERAVSAPWKWQPGWEYKLASLD
jgi:broad specificity phosphatase PhoE